MKLSFASYAHSSSVAHISGIFGRIWMSFAAFETFLFPVFRTRSEHTNSAPSIAFFVHDKIVTTIGMTIFAVSFLFLLNKVIVQFIVKVFSHQFKMFGINAFSLVANMMNTVFGWNFSFEQFITESMSHHSSISFCSWNGRITISRARARSLPYPTTGRIYYKAGNESYENVLSFRSCFCHKEHFTAYGA